MTRFSLLAALALLSFMAAAAGKPPSSADILAGSAASDWRRLADDELLVMRLPAGEVLIELAPAFAPRHVANIKALVAERYFDGLAVLRVQDNYVAQWGDADAKKPIRHAEQKLAPEFSRVVGPDFAFAPLPDADAYAPAPLTTGLSLGWPVVRDPAKNEAWLAHCYAMVGVGRDNAAESGSGAELYAVIGHAPRHLDRNVTLVGRVVQGIDLLSSLPRGTEALGFYKKASQRVPVASVRLASSLPAAKRPALEALRTDTPTWQAFVEARRHRHEEWFIEPTGHIELCNVPLPVRRVAP